MLVTAQSRVDEGLFPGTGRLVDDGMSAICDNGYELADVLFPREKVAASGDGVVCKWGFHVVILVFRGSKFMKKSKFFAFNL